ncbi:hypothetical protein LUZ63_009927 [Rhynchospora breviuscula]|uniref:HMA domain-containing protein n=1 Tax=Rhynchospora breviuscula TaxID=2022672 RepID=A0A9Q0CGT5_9POAL|nr:hypothetical protein LUZ63_009927 [Rhynchospora breviuscula]
MAGRRRKALVRSSSPFQIQNVHVVIPNCSTLILPPLTNSHSFNPFIISFSPYYLGNILDMQKVVLKVDLNDDRDKKNVMKTVSSIYGVDSISVDMKDKKLTVIGFVDPVDLVSKLRKQWYTEIFSVGPAKEPVKKDANKQVAELVGTYKPYNPYMTTHYYARSMEDNPNACVIC